MKGYVTDCSVVYAMDGIPEATVTLKLSGDCNTEDLMSGPVEIVPAGVGPQLATATGNQLGAATVAEPDAIDWSLPQSNLATDHYLPGDEGYRRTKLCEEVRGDTSPASTSSMWLGMAYAAVLLGAGQLWFWIGGLA